MCVCLASRKVNDLKRKKCWTTKAKNIQRWERVASRPWNRLPVPARSTSFLLLLLCSGLQTESIFAPGPAKETDINSRKKHEREVMCLTHEHNRLDQRNLVSCARFYLQQGRAWEINAAEVFTSALDTRRHFELGVVLFDLPMVRPRGSLGDNEGLRCRRRAYVESQLYRWSGSNSTVGTLTSNSGSAPPHDAADPAICRMKIERCHTPCLNPQVARRENVFIAPHKSETRCSCQQDSAPVFIFSSIRSLLGVIHPL